MPIFMADLFPDEDFKYIFDIKHVPIDFWLDSGIKSKFINLKVLGSDMIARNSIIRQRIVLSILSASSLPAIIELKSVLLNIVRIPKMLIVR